MPLLIQDFGKILDKGIELVRFGHKACSEFFEFLHMDRIGSRRIHNHLDVIEGPVILDQFEAFKTIHLRHIDVQKDVIRNFDDEEAYHLQCFYQKLAEESADDFTARRNYLSNINL